MGGGQIQMGSWDPPRPAMVRNAPRAALGPDADLTVSIRLSWRLLFGKTCRGVGARRRSAPPETGGTRRTCSANPSRPPQTPNPSRGDARRQQAAATDSRAALGTVPCPPHHLRGFGRWERSRRRHRNRGHPHLGSFWFSEAQFSS